ncbi:redoxin domain-containing protein [Pedobacter sp. AW31-3R]|uniref:redoxin domain-containing protein n=1 Tax=Pedobacter sp. AW31-3R TaxID=3445781 RepID=UPI003FA06FB1
MRTPIYIAMLSFCLAGLSLSTRAQSVAPAVKATGLAKDFTNSMFAQQDISKLEGMLETFKQKFPDESLDGPYFALSYMMAKNGSQPEKAIKYAELIENKKQNLTSAYYTGETVAAVDPKLALPFLKRALKRHQYILTDTTADLSGRFAYWRMEYTYGMIAKKNGKMKEALEYLGRAYKAQENDQEVVIAYAELQQDAGNDQLAFPILDKVVKSGQGNPALKKRLVQSYARLHPAEDANAYVSAISEEIRQQVQQEYLKKVLNSPAPAFILQDEKGKTVSLADFKGKTIVLDFWATWCGPCKKSFPAMQLAVDKYKDDPEVKFLFIHTWETSNTPLQDARKYLNDNKYTFDLYIDPKEAGGTKNQSAAMFGFKGIPQKYIIDKQGHIRFSAAGFSGGEDAAVEELSAMIEYAKKN